CEVLRVGVCPVALMTGDLVAAERAVAMLIDLSSGLGSPFWELAARCLEGKLLIARGCFEKGANLLRTMLEKWETQGWAIWHPDFLSALAQGYAGLGQRMESLATVDRALARADRGGERLYVPELLRIKGELLLDGGDQSISTAEECFHGALEVAQEQSA